VKVIPAIDLLDGRAVRLVRGDRSTATAFSDEPWILAREFGDAGAERIHVVDLDGAFAGAPANRAAIDRILATASVPIQVGGGLRDEAALEAMFDAGASFAVLGTAAIKRPEFVAAACRAQPGRIIVAVDARDGRVAVEGWVEVSELTAMELGTRARAWGAGALLYTDVSRDGVQTGPNVETTALLAAEVGLPVIASGGISSLDDLRRLDAARIPMAIVGRALYERRFTLEEAIAAC
jgi:phosphoribosylformimino-5-aminoimidazole carboxamide ribotide isomerase